MIIYPAIDIKGGKCVRLLQGRFDDVTIYGDDPVTMAQKWAGLGGGYIHIVDLDGALDGKSINGEAIEKIAGSVLVPVQTGGGIRSMADIEYKLSKGVSRVILGTVAVRDTNIVKEAVLKYGDKIAVGIDAKDGKVAVSGWEEVTSYDAVTFAKRMEEFGVRTIIYTDIATDGMLSGPNIAAMRQMADAVSCDVIASGGVGSVKDITDLIPTGVKGVIVGKALYTGRVDLPEAIEKVRKRLC